MRIDKGSFATVPMKHLSGLCPQVQCLYMWLCRYANEDGNCFPSMGTLAKDCGLSESMIRRYMRELESIRLVVRETRLDASGRQTSNTYSVYDTPCIHAGGEGGIHAGGEGGIHAGVYIELNHKELNHIEKQYSCAIFQNFWTLYPKKVDKEKTWTVWKHFSPEEREQAVFGLQQWNRYWSQISKDEHRFIIYPERFLKRRRFENDAMVGELQPKLASLQNPQKLNQWQRTASDKLNENFDANMQKLKADETQREHVEETARMEGDRLYRFFLSLSDGTQESIEARAKEQLIAAGVFENPVYPKIYEAAKRAKIISLVRESIDEQVQAA